MSAFDLIAQSMPSHAFSWSLPWWAWIPIVAIVCGSLCGMVSSILTHRERMAMIRMGIHPDVKPGEEPLSPEKPHHPEEAEF